MTFSGCEPSDTGVQPSNAVPTTRPATDQSPPDRESPAAADSGAWPGWRGPGGRGVLPQCGLPQPLEKRQPRLRWQQKLGTGWSSPVVADNRVFVTDRLENKERLLAFDSTTGRPLWQATNPVDFDPHSVGRRHGNGPKSTPAVEASRVYSLGIAGWLQAVDTQTGSVVWSINLPERFGEKVPLPGGRAFVEGTDHVIVPVGNGQGAPVPLFGYTGSILLADGLVILSVGGARGGTVMAFDARDGRVQWAALDEHVSYSSPVVAELGSVKQVVVMTGPRVVGLRLVDGKLLWSHPFQIEYDESISTPSVAANLVLVTGNGHPLTALEIPKTLSAEKPASVRADWENWDLSSYLSSMVVQGDHMYGMGDDGQFACVRLADGTTAWRGGNHGTYCSPVLCGERLLGLNEMGELAIVAATPTAYRELGQFSVADNQTWTVPAVVGRGIYVRSQDALTAYDFGP